MTSLANILNEITSEYFESLIRNLEGHGVLFLDKSHRPHGCDLTLMWGEKPLTLTLDLDLNKGTLEVKGPECKPSSYTAKSPRRQTPNNRDTNTSQIMVYLMANYKEC